MKERRPGKEGDQLEREVVQRVEQEEGEKEKNKEASQGSNWKDGHAKLHSGVQYNE